MDFLLFHRCRIHVSIMSPHLHRRQLATWGVFQKAMLRRLLLLRMSCSRLLTRMPSTINGSLRPSMPSLTLARMRILLYRALEGHRRGGLAMARAFGLITLPCFVRLRSALRSIRHTLPRIARTHMPGWSNGRVKTLPSWGDSRAMELDLGKCRCREQRMKACRMLGAPRTTATRDAGWRRGRPVTVHHSRAGHTTCRTEVVSMPCLMGGRARGWSIMTMALARHLGGPSHVRQRTHHHVSTALHGEGWGCTRRATVP